ncbi:hypothetical protein CerSpe_210070 [Prunus speciosa]
MAEGNKVTLHGSWLSLYTKRVELALKTKGIPFEFVEEDLNNKIPLLLKYNPVHKNVPVQSRPLFTLSHPAPTLAPIPFSLCPTRFGLAFGASTLFSG